MSKVRGVSTPAAVPMFPTADLPSERGRPRRRTVTRAGAKKPGSPDIQCPAQEALLPAYLQIAIGQGLRGALLLSARRASRLGLGQDGDHANQPLNVLQELISADVKRGDLRPMLADEVSRWPPGRSKRP